MKNKRSVTAGVVIITVIGIIVIVASLLNIQAPQPQATATDTSLPVASLTPDPCTQENIAASITALEKTSRAFDDEKNIAQGTANAQLAPIIAELQKNRRDVDDFQVPPCLDTLKAQLMGYINSYIDFYLVLYSSASVAAPGITQKQFDDAMTAMSASANQHYRDVVDYANKFVVEKSRLLGVTPPAPVPTIDIVGTPGGPSSLLPTATP